MKRFYFAFAALAALSLSACSAAGPQPAAASNPTPAAATSTADAEQAVIALEKKMWELTKNKQVQEYRNALAPDYRAISEEGAKNADNDAQDITTFDIKEYALSDFRAAFPNPEAVVLTYKATMKVAAKGVEETRKRNSAAVWAKQNGEWKCFLYTGTKEEPQTKQ